jgi:hypothetical protein
MQKLPPRLKQGAVKVFNPTITLLISVFRYLFFEKTKSISCNGCYVCRRAEGYVFNKVGQEHPVSVGSKQRKLWTDKFGLVQIAQPQANLSPLGHRPFHTNQYHMYWHNDVNSKIFSSKRAGQLESSSESLVSPPDQNYKVRLLPFKRGTSANIRIFQSICESQRQALLKYKGIFKDTLPAYGAAPKRADWMRAVSEFKPRSTSNELDQLYLSPFNYRSYASELVLRSV